MLPAVDRQESLSRPVMARRPGGAVASVPIVHNVVHGTDTSRRPVCDGVAVSPTARPMLRGDAGGTYDVLFASRARAIGPRLRFRSRLLVGRRRRRGDRVRGTNRRQVRTSEPGDGGAVPAVLE